jgi:RNA polymerase sigma-70 factor (ECF subfamily)
MESTHERELIRRLASGDRGAFAPLYQAHVRALYAIALRLAGNYEDAEESVQDAFLELARLGPKALEIESLRAWLLRVVTRRAIDNHRRRQAREGTAPHDGLEQLDAVAAATANPAQVAHEAQLAGRIRELVRLLPERQGAAFSLRHFHALSIAEVASVMELTDGAVKAHLFQATQALRTALIAEGYLTAASNPSRRKESGR